MLALFATQASFAYAAATVCLRDGCCGESDQDDRGDCPCPLPCAPQCCGHYVPVLPASEPMPVVAAPFEVELVMLVYDETPPSVEQRDISHVPKSGRV